MSKVKIFIGAVLLTLAISVSSQAANKPTRLFLYGFAASFNDSIVYITNIEELDTAWVDAKTGFLYSRDNYSYQLRDYLRAKGVDHPTCITVYATTRKQAEKKYTSLKRRYTAKGAYDIRYITEDEFTFSPIVPDVSEIQPSDAEKKAAKAEKKAEKKDRKHPGRPEFPGQPGQPGQPGMPGNPPGRPAM